MSVTPLGESYQTFYWLLRVGRETQASFSKGSDTRLDDKRIKMLLTKPLRDVPVLTSVLSDNFADDL